MRKTRVTVALAGTLGLTGAALLVPSSALAQAGPAGERVSALQDALKGLVGDGTLTQAQADKVATSLAEQLPARGEHSHRGGPGGVGRVVQEEVAKALGITVEQLRTERRAGKTLAQIAAAQGLDKAELIDRLVVAAKAQLAAAVQADRITQTRADELATRLEARITEQVDQVRDERGRHSGHGGHGGHGRSTPDGTETPDTGPTPEVEPSST